jgi:hypothetical protein
MSVRKGKLTGYGGETAVRNERIDLTFSLNLTPASHHRQRVAGARG